MADPASHDSANISVFLVQQGVWDMPLESMPLASGYLKATALTDDLVRRSASIDIKNFRGGTTNSAMANELFSDGTPDVIAFSVLGWNYRAFGALAASFRQLNPDGWVIFGGTHVAGQAERVFRMFPEVDVVVNGEGELTFRDLLSARIRGDDRRALHHVDGISFQHEGTTVTTADRDRIEDLEVIASPVLTGAIDLTDEHGAFRYDVALMETNRGCPYKCAFCYWGGAVGQKIRAFSLDRLRRELEVFGRLKVHTVVACDANFGLLPGDVDFVEALIETRERFGFPRALETSWAKNKSKTFYRIVKRMKEAGMRSSFTLALQTLDERALDSMNRRNMKLNDWEELSAWLDREGLDCYAELLWGAPGETVKSFMEGYDRLSRRVSRIAVYPIMLLPNTDYFEKKKEYGITSVRGDHDDFEYVLAHHTMTFAENRQMQRFLFWARVIAENAVLRYIWLPLRQLAGLTQSQVLLDLDTWIVETAHPAAAPLRSHAATAMGGTAAFGAAITYLYTDPAGRRLLQVWWQESIRPRLPTAMTPLLDDVFRYDLVTQPVYLGGAGDARADDLPVIELYGETYHVRHGIRLDHDVPRIHSDLRADRDPDLRPTERVVDLYYRTGAVAAVTSTNHEIVVHFMGMTEQQVRRHAIGDAGRGGPADDGAGPEPVDPGDRTTLTILNSDEGGCS
ncbi:KedN5 family methylcobalamin-dependent radical SAM C-methyltransferase [Actinoplanes rectilineatus]|uniref:KedN5 family methylcobalamin-dependent radical SAM C-methyltransferase n=1 Tax=Actinoplanes rectilineatus TaxID=113571 RepID=UPI000A70997F|nr:KedN5 family methylcobalamin-dependent radical SAM C-methyltransferase [Actinoplanes rectilineatus]